MAFEKISLAATVRNQLGKGPSHRLRKSGFVPAIVYSGGKEATSIALNPKETSKILLTPLRRNVVFTLNLQDDKGTALGSKVVMARDVQIDPVKRHLLHADLIEIDPSKKVKVKIPLTLNGKSKSVVAGGKLEQVCKAFNVMCMPNGIPEKLELDVTELPFGTTHVTQIQLPANVDLAEDAHLAVVTIRQPRAEKEETGAPAAAASTPAAPTAETKK